jgi:hypothetical protein
VEQTITSNGPLIPEWALADVIDRISQEPTTTKVNDAVALTERLIGQNPQTNAQDPKTYFNALVAIFAAYPRSLGQMAVHNVDGVVANTKFTVKPSDLKAFLDKAKADRDLVVHNAKAQLAEHARRRKEAESEELYAKASQTAEQRAAFVKRMLGYNPTERGA